jgi:type IX secretion system PorP/SprF family membrane protein
MLRANIHIRLVKLRQLYKIAVVPLLYIVLLMNIGHYASAQDLHFSQFFETPILRNPSLSGIFPGDIRAQLVHRNQWNSVTNAYKTSSVNATYKLPTGKGDDFFTAGLQLLYDKAGTLGLTTAHVLPAIGYYKAINAEKQSYVSVGFMGGLVQKRIDRSKITTNAQYDGLAYNPALANGENITTPNLSYWDGAVGVNYFSAFGTDNKHNFFAGAAYHHFHRPPSSFYRNEIAALNAKWGLSGGMQVSINEVNFFNIQVDYSVQGPASQIIGGVLYGYKIGDIQNPDYTLQGGLMWRWRDAVIPVVKLDYNPFSLALSYDVNVSALKTASQYRGGFELSVSYIGFLNRYNEAKYKMGYPRFQ